MDQNGQLTARQETILGLTVREYVRSASPVSSRALVDRYGLPVSSATVRNELAYLEETGHLTHPHTSAGRVPTHEGYRYFVERLLGEVELPLRERLTIVHQFHQARHNLEQWMPLAASTLAQAARGAAVVTAPQSDEARYKHLQLISTRGVGVLLVMVLQSGMVKQRMLTLAEPLSQRELAEASERLNQLCAGSTAREIERDLKEGKEGQEVYGKHEDVFGKFASYMLAIASTSGNMAQVFESTAKFMERDAEFKKNLRRSLLMPSITFIAIIATLIFYVGYIFPKTAEMFAKFDITLPPMTAATLDVSYWIQGNWLIMTLAVVIPIIGLVVFVRTPKGRLWFDRVLLKIPVIGDLMHKTSIEIFARVFYTLYSGSGENVDVIRVAAEACRNRYMEKQIKTVSIPMMLKEGKGLVESLEAAKVFTKTAMGRFRLGAESGSLRDNSKQLADYYELQTSYKMESVIDSINLSISMIIMIVLVFITIVSSETAVIQPNTPM